jgi:hypothetical protein
MSCSQSPKILWDNQQMEGVNTYKKIGAEMSIKVASVLDPAERNVILVQFNVRL